MDFTTRLAIQAVVRGLFRSSVITGEQVRSVMAELQYAARHQSDRGHQMDAEELMNLASEVGKDAKVGD